ncbi:MAG: SpoIIE family protein phosphatase [Cytophagales bacterium]|nr:SpoIIE family protein phosphatase [Cytophagales bacterium]MDW8384688.1 SpoIIE family protein phosphatase [Flammeovirgaceae bacterium]
MHKVFLILLCLHFCLYLKGQQHLLQQATNLYNTSQYDEAQTLLEENLFQLEPKEKIKAYLLLGDIFRAKQQFSQSLNTYLQSAYLSENQKYYSLLAESYHKIGLLYLQRELHEKALENLQLAEKKYLENYLQPPAEMYENLALVCSRLKKFTEAEDNYQKVLSLYAQQKNYEKQRFILRRLIILSNNSNNFEKAHSYTLQLKKLAEENQDKIEEAYCFNNLGYLSQKQGKQYEAGLFFEKAIHLLNDITFYSRTKAIILNNAGITYTNQRQFENARRQYEKAREIFLQNKDMLSTAETDNYLAINAFYHKKMEDAISFAESAIKIAEPLEAYDILAASYKILSEIYSNEGSIDLYKYYQQKLIEVNQKQIELLSLQQKQQNTAQLEAEKQESSFKLLIANTEKQELALKQMILETEKQQQDLRLKEQQLQLLQKEQELQKQLLSKQKLEKERAQQALLLAQQQLEAEKRNKEILALQQQQEKQALQLREQEAIRREQEKAIKLAQAQQKLQEIQIQEQKKTQFYTRLVMALGTLLFLFVIYAYMRSQQRRKELTRLNEEIKKQQIELQEKNAELLANEEELRQSYEELSATKETIEQQRDELEKINRHITQQRDIIEQKNINILSSINYASRIQKALLPSESYFRKFFNDAFIFYKPRDIVSGDFYWIDAKGNAITFAVADCTGHGVPGAFMSTIGIELLNNIILLRGVRQPDLILTTLNYSLTKLLYQQNDEKTIRDGMDIAICHLELLSDSSYQLQFAGAKSPIVVFSNHQEIFLKGDNKPIGGQQELELIDYALHTLQLEKGDSIYMYTDGFQDAFGGPDNRKFMSKNFRKLLSDIHTQPFEEQKLILEHTLEDWIGTHQQIDDVCVVGVKIG